MLAFSIIEQAAGGTKPVLFIQNLSTVLVQELFHEWRNAFFLPHSEYSALSSQMSNSVEGWRSLFIVGFRPKVEIESSPHPRIDWLPRDPKMDSIQAHCLACRFQI